MVKPIGGTTEISVTTEGLGDDLPSPLNSLVWLMQMLYGSWGHSGLLQNQSGGDASGSYSSRCGSFIGTNQYSPWHFVCSYWSDRCFLPIPFSKKNQKKFAFFFILFYLFIYFWLCWVFISMRGLSLVVASGGHSSSRCAGLSLSRPLLLQSTGSRRAGSVIVAHGPSWSAACGIFPDQGSNPCPLHWQADSQPLRHQGSPAVCF